MSDYVPHPRFMEEALILPQEEFRLRRALEAAKGNLVKITIKAPRGAFYSGPDYPLEILVTSTYPREAPTLTCLKPIWHPSVDPDTGVYTPRKPWKEGDYIFDLIARFKNELLAPMITGRDGFNSYELFKNTALYWMEVFRDSCGKCVLPSRDSEHRDWNDKVEEIGDKLRNRRTALVRLSQVEWNIDAVEY